MAIFDLSEYQGTIDFGKVKSNTDLLILRVQAGSTHPDTHYAQYVAGCKANNVPFGTYAYAKYISVADAQQEAKDCFARMDKDSKFVVVDVESVSTTVATQLASATQAFIDYLHGQGVSKVGLYSGESFYLSHGLSTVKADFLWIAKYGTNDGQMHTRPTMACDLWQYSSTATESGVVGHVDIDALNGSKPLSYFTGVESTVTGTTKQTIFLPASNDTWTVYKMGHPCSKSNPANVAGELAPKRFGGLTYDIKGTTGPNCYIIHTDAFGDVQIYGASSTGAIIKTVTVTPTAPPIPAPQPQPAPVAPTPLPFVGCLDSPTDGQKLSGNVYIHGWVLDNNGIASVEVQIDGKKIADATIGVERTDVQKAYPDYNNANGGFTYSLDSTKLSVGNHKLSVIGHAKNGSTKGFDINVNIEAQPISVPQPAPPPQPAKQPTPVVVQVVEPKPAPVVTVSVATPTAPTPKPVEAPVVAPTAPVASLAQQIEDAVMKDPQLQKNFAKKILDFFISLFK